MNRLLLVEDDEALTIGIEFTLKDEGYELYKSRTFKKGIELYESMEFDLIILDINLPDGNGYDLCKYIRRKSDVPIIFLTARDDEANLVLGLEIGGDDYISKPFRVRELTSRIKALIRRSSKTIVTGTNLRCEDILVNTSIAVVSKKEKEITLTAQEYKLLLIFMNRPNILMKREEILNELIEGEEVFFDENTLSVYIKRVRGKIEDNPREPEYIVTQRGLGYKWAKDVKKE